MKANDIEQIISGCQRGESGSFERLIELYSRRLYGYFYRLSGSRQESDELLSEIFLKIVGKINSYNGGSFEGWLFKTASNVFHDYIRSKARYERLLAARKEDMEARGQADQRQEPEEKDALQVQLNKLDADTREAITMRFYSGLSFREMAKLRGEPIGTTLSKVHRGLKRLRDLMGR